EPAVAKSLQANQTAGFCMLRAHFGSLLILVTAAGWTSCDAPPTGPTQPVTGATSLGSGETRQTAELPNSATGRSKQRSAGVDSVPKSRPATGGPTLDTPPA